MSATAAACCCSAALLRPAAPLRGHLLRSGSGWLPAPRLGSPAPAGSRLGSGDTHLSAAAADSGCPRPPCLRKVGVPDFSKTSVDTSFGWVYFVTLVVERKSGCPEPSPRCRNGKVGVLDPLGPAGPPETRDLRAEEWVSWNALERGTPSVLERRPGTPSESGCPGTPGKSGCPDPLGPAPPKRGTHGREVGVLVDPSRPRK